MKRFKEGDRVQLIEKPFDAPKRGLNVGWEGTITRVMTGTGFDYAIDWDNEFTDGYACNDDTRPGHGWCVHEDVLEKAEGEINGIEEDSLSAFYAI